MRVPRSVAQMLRKPGTLEVESIDRMYLHVYIPRRQHECGVAGFSRVHRGHPFASSARMEPISKAFSRALEAVAAQAGVPLRTVAPRQRKDAVMAAHLARVTAPDGGVVLGKAPEKTTVCRTEKRKRPTTGQCDPWIVRDTALVDHDSIDGGDQNVGPFVLKVGASFPSTATLCRNGHEYLKRQLAQRGIAVDPLDNGIQACADPRRLQALADGLAAAKLAALLRKWLARLPHPFAPADRRAGSRYACAILQLECRLPQVLDRPLTGRVFFEEVIRENLDLGRSDQGQRRVTRRTPGRFRTRVLSEGGTPGAPPRLQALPDHTGPQSGPGAPDRDHQHRCPRLRARQAAAKPRRVAAGRLLRPPTSPRRPTGPPRLPSRRSRLRPGAAAPRGRGRRLPAAPGAPARPRAARPPGRPRALRPPAPAAPRRHRAHPDEPPVPGDHGRPPAGVVLHPDLCAPVASRPRARRAHPPRRRRCPPGGLRSIGTGGGCLVYPGHTRRVTLDAVATRSVLQATLAPILRNMATATHQEPRGCPFAGEGRARHERGAGSLWFPVPCGPIPLGACLCVPARRQVFVSSASSDSRVLAL